MLISLLTLIIFIYQTNLLREQSRLSVVPRLAFHSSLDTPDSISYFSFHLVNKGLGPAIVESIYIIHDEKKLKFDFRKYIENHYPQLEDFGAIVQNMGIITGDAISEKEGIKFLTYAFKYQKTKAIMEYLQLDEEENMPFEIEVIYSSIYGEQWKVRSNQKGHPIKLGS